MSRSRKTKKAWETVPDCRRLRHDNKIWCFILDCVLFDLSDLMGKLEKPEWGLKIRRWQCTNVNFLTLVAILWFWRKISFCVGNTLEFRVDGTSHWQLNQVVWEKGSLFRICNFYVSKKQNGQYPPPKKIQNKTMMQIYVSWKTQAIYKRQVGWRHPLRLHLLFFVNATSCPSISTWRLLLGSASYITLKYHHLGWVLMGLQQNQGSSLPAALPALCQLLHPAPTHLTSSPAADWGFVAQKPRSACVTVLLKILQSSLSIPGTWSPTSSHFHVLVTACPVAFSASAPSFPHGLNSTEELPFPIPIPFRLHGSVIPFPQFSSPWRTSAHSSRPSSDVHLLWEAFPDLLCPTPGKVNYPRQGERSLPITLYILSHHNHPC